MDYHTLAELSRQRQEQIAHDARAWTSEHRATMSPWLAEVLTRAHAPAWRCRYGDEFRALLQELPGTPATIASAVWSAFRSRVLPI
jgi:hypothetical protein